jgi:hypothetical protein
MRAPEQPEPGEREHEHRRPAKQSVFAVDEERDQAVRALEVPARERGVRGGLLTDVGGVGRGAPVEGLVQPHVEGDAEQGELDGPEGERPPPHPPERPRRQEADHHAGGHELRTEPREHAEQGEAAKRVAPARAVVEPQREKGPAGQRGPGAQLGVDRRAVREEGRAQPDGQRGAERPRVGHHAEREPVGERHGQRRDRRQEQLDALRAAERVGGGDQEREAQAVRLVETTVRLLAVPVQVVRVEVVVRPGGVLVLDVDIAVLDKRLGGEQIVRLVAGVVGVAERVESEGRRVGGEEEEPEGRRPSHGRRASTRAR